MKLGKNVGNDKGTNDLNHAAIAIPYCKALPSVPVLKTQGATVGSGSGSDDKRGPVGLERILNAFPS